MNINEQARDFLVVDENKFPREDYILVVYSEEKFTLGITAHQCLTYDIQKMMTLQESKIGGRVP